MEDLRVRLRCPSCDALVPPTAEWCSLCYADLRPPAPDEPAVDEQGAASEPVDEQDAASEPVDDVPAPGRPVEAAVPGPGTPDSGEAAVLARADAMLAELAAQTPPTLSGLPSRLRTKEARLVVMIGGVVVCAVLLFAVMWLAGALL